MATIPTLLAIAVLLPLLSFALILVLGPRLGKHGSFAGVLATMAILGAGLLSFTSLGLWLAAHPPHDVAHHDAAHDDLDHADAVPSDDHAESVHATTEEQGGHQVEHKTAASAAQVDHGTAAEGVDQADAVKPPLAGDWYTLGNFGHLKLTIGYYVDALTIAMFCMVTLIASCIHFYAIGYMHDELHEVTDHEVTVHGEHLHRPGRYHRFFQFLSLFSFSMLGLVVAGNIAMTFVFWELVGICSYFLIGFYVERQSASTAANKAFIVNRIGDFGMIIGLMALWGSLGTFAFGDVDGQPGLFSLVRPASQDHRLVVPAQMAAMSASAAPGGAGISTADGEAPQPGPGYWLLVVAGVGIFCGCVGKSAQFPLHVWLPDAMEGPTPVSALVHSATMVAAGVFLVARFFPVFAPEVLLVIATVGTITLFMAATIAITATDIKRVLAYSTVSQLGYMMVALGVGGWVAGVMHLITHAFFKSLLFMCSGSVIHGVHTNEMTLMGGLRKKMPWTAYTMLIGCLAIAGAGIPFVIGFSGYYSKDAILEQALSYGHQNPGVGYIFFLAAAGGAAITAFYMFRLWYMTFAGKPRDQHRYDHAHESPPVMYVPLVVLAVFAVGVAWGPREAFGGSILAALIFLTISILRRRQRGETATVQAAWKDLLVPITICGLVLVLSLIWRPFANVTLQNLLEQARPLGTAQVGMGQVSRMMWPNEHDSHAMSIKGPATIVAFSTALGGILLATIFYGWRILSPDDVRRQFAGVYSFLRNKWWFDELYDRIFVRPTLILSRLASTIDLTFIDGIINGLAAAVRRFANLGEAIVDRGMVDGFVNKLADWTYALGLQLRRPETGQIRQYVLFIAIAVIAIFILASFFLGSTLAG